MQTLQIPLKTESIQSSVIRTGKMGLQYFSGEISKRFSVSGTKKNFVFVSNTISEIICELSDFLLQEITDNFWKSGFQNS